ncbi:hypothetical protein GGQ21_001226 [Salinibacter ruber]|nr:hypothetical protein [Salinibacter ruber]
MFLGNDIIMLYGLQRSGTNFVQDTIERNLRVWNKNIDHPRNNPSHKHYRPYSEECFPTSQYVTRNEPSNLKNLESIFNHEPPDYYVVVSKSPYSWLLSYEKWGRKCDWPDPDHHYITEWNLFYGKWLEWGKSSRKVVFVRYVDMLQDPKGEVERLQQRMGLTRRWISYIQRFTPGSVEQSPDFDASRRRYYLEHEYLNQYTDEKWDSLHAHLDTDVVQGLGYKIKDR